MTKLEKEAEEKAFSYAQLIPCSPYMEKRHREIDFKEGYFAGAEPREKQIEIDAKQIRALQKTNGALTDKVKELETSVSNLRKDNKELREVLPKLDKENDELKYKISLLLSCKDCPENKGGLICSKEYNDKCLAQKIEYIKELKEENKVLAQNLEDTEIINNALEKENAELRKIAEFGYNKANEWHKVADEGLPINKNDGATYLLYTIYGKGGSPVVAHFAYRDKQELMNVWTGAILTEDKIVVWKEIVLPKESE